MKKIGLICEGGGTKGAYTCGVLQCFLDQGIKFPYTVGISMGAVVLAAFVSEQRERLRVIGVDATSHKNSIGLVPLRKEKGIFGIHFVCDFLEENAPFDYEKFMKSETELEIGVYNMETNELEYIGKDGLDYPEQNLIKASCALFLLTKPVKYNGKLYMDAGIVDMIPIQQSVNAGMDKHIFISTKEENYERKPAPGYQLAMAGLAYPKNKQVKEYLRIRHENYKKQWGIVKDLQDQGKALVLRPSEDQGITRYTNDKDKLQKWFQLGYDDTMARLADIKAFMES